MIDAEPDQLPPQLEPEDGEGAPPDERVKDTGELYGVHTPPAADRELGEDAESYKDAELGESWLESLELSAAEGGPEPEHEIDVQDDSDRDHPLHHATEGKDRPVADKGSGGRGGM
ncbi:MAG TPA: hypothetical protein VLX92_25935 [Kofleriaceae bacterium]|nr:hypothetical protein [Kofleriaceae bacterium]